MSQFGRTLSTSILFMMGTGYFALLFLALVWLRLSPEIVLSLTVGGIALVAMSLRPYIGVHIFIVVLFLENVLGGEGGVSPMKIVGGVILASWLVSIATQRRSGFTFDRFTLLLLLFLLWNGVSLLNAFDANAAVNRMFTYAQAGLSALMFSAVVNTPERMRRVYWSIVILVSLNTVVAIVMYYMGQTPNASGLMRNRNLLAVYINIAIICAYLLYQGSKSGLGRLALVTALPILFLGMGLTFSRGGLIALSITLVFVWLRVARQKRFLLLAMSLGIMCGLTYVLPTAFWKRAESIVPAIQRQQDTFGTRVKLWHTGIRMVEDRPLLGVGPGNFVAAFPRYARGSERFYHRLATHNAYIGIAAETGLVGLGLFLLMYGMALRAARRGISIGKTMARPDLEMHSVVAEVSLLALLMASLTGDAHGLKILWVFLGLAVAAGQIAERAATQAQPSKEPAPVPMEGVMPWALARPPR